MAVQWVLAFLVLLEMYVCMQAALIDDTLAYRSVAGV